EFRQVVLSARGAALIRNRVERGVDIGGEAALAPNRFSRQEAAGRDGDALVVDRQGALQLAAGLLLFLQRSGGVGDVGLQVIHVALDRGYIALLLLVGLRCLIGLALGLRSRGL